MALKTCMKCGKAMEENNNFYKRNDKTTLDLCKRCATMHINNFEPETFLWLLKEIDVPYIPSEWNVLRDRAYAKNPNLTGMSVFGKYLSKMKLKQFYDKDNNKQYGWDDSEKLQAIYETKDRKKIEEWNEYADSLKVQFEAGEITEAQYKTLTSTEAQMSVLPQTSIPPMVSNPFIEENFQDIPEIIVDLTNEEKVRLAIKWGKLYKPSEWVELERNYTEMCKSFDIQDADSINTLKMLCKTNLKANQALDCGDVEGFQKLSKVADSLRKSAKFTAAQNKEQKDEFVDCVGNLVAYCEKEGGKIPRYEIGTPLDIVDTVINDLKAYTKTLIYEDKSLAKQIEDYLKKIEIAKQQKEDREKAKQNGLDNIELEDDDYSEYFDDMEFQLQADDEIYQEEIEE